MKLISDQTGSAVISRLQEIDFKQKLIVKQERIGRLLVRVCQTRAVVNYLDNISVTRYGVAMSFDRQSKDAKVKG